MKLVKAAVKAVIKREDKFLVIKQELPDKIVWDLPGGKVEYGESPYDTLKREVMEEVCVPIDIIKPIGMFWFFIQDNIQVICTTFLCTLTDDSKIDITKNPADENISEFRWVTKEEFLTDEYPVGDNSLKDLVRRDV